MFVKITLFKTDFDEENIFIPTNTEYPNIFDFQPKMEDRLSLLKSKYEYLELVKSSYNPREPFRIAKNAFDIKGVYNYAVFDFDTEKGENDNTPINKYRYYFIRDIVFVNDNVSQLIVKEDILPRVYNYLDIKQCLPESYTFKKSRIKKRDYKNLTSDNIYSFVKGFSNVNKVIVNNREFQLFFLIVTCLKGEVTQIDPYTSGYIENGSKYPFINIILPFVFDVENELIRVIIDGELQRNGNSEVVELATIEDFFRMSYITNAGFKIVSTCISQILPIVENFTFNQGENLKIKFAPECVSVVNFSFSENGTSKTFITFSDYADDIENDIIINEDFLLDFFDDYAKIGYKKIVFSCAQNDTDIDPIMFLRKNNYSTPSRFYLRQSFVPPYNIYFGIKNAFNDEENNVLLYYNKYGVTISNPLSAGTYTDNYTEFLRTNYNSTVTGLSVQQSASRELLGVQQDLQMTQFAYSTQKKIVKETAKAWLTGGLSAIGFGVNTGVDYANLQATQEASRESLSINQEKENALLELKIADIKNTPDTASFYGSISECILSAKYPRVTFWENVSLGVAKRGHKIFGFTLPQNINKIQSHYRFDYLRSKDLTLSFINGFSPTELERAEIEDTFNKGIRIWWTLDDYKNFDLENAEV